MLSAIGLVPWGYNFVDFIKKYKCFYVLNPLHTRLHKKYTITGLAWVNLDDPDR